MESIRRVWCECLGRPVYSIRRQIGWIFLAMSRPLTLMAPDWAPVDRRQVNKNNSQFSPYLLTMEATVLGVFLFTGLSLASLEATCSLLGVTGEVGAEGIFSMRSLGSLMAGLTTGSRGSVWPRTIVSPLTAGRSTVRLGPDGDQSVLAAHCSAGLVRPSEELWAGMSVRLGSELCRDQSASLGDPHTSHSSRPSIETRNMSISRLFL